MFKLKIRKGDSVLVMTGKDRGKTGKVLAAFPREGRLLVEGRNMVKKHLRPRRRGEKGQRVEVPAPVPVSRVMLVCPSCGKATRVGIVRAPGAARQRQCKKCRATFP